MSNLVKPKDSQWLQVDVCREFQQSHCPRGDDACKYAHPGSKIEITDGKVMVSYPSLLWIELDIVNCSRPAMIVAKEGAAEKFANSTIPTRS